MISKTFLFSLILLTFVNSEIVSFDKNVLSQIYKDRTDSSTQGKSISFTCMATTTIFK